jgi:hypothetical protein
MWRAASGDVVGGAVGEGDPATVRVADADGSVAVAEGVLADGGGAGSLPHAVSARTRTDTSTRSRSGRGIRFMLRVRSEGR